MSWMKKSYYFSILSAPRFINPSQFELVTAPPLIFVEELEYKCLESGDEILGRWETTFDGNLPQPTRKLRSRKR